MQPVFDSDRLTRAVIDAAHQGLETGDPRRAIVAAIAPVLAEGREKARTLLDTEKNGLHCAARLSNLMDGIIRALFEAATSVLFRSDNPSTSERLAVAAVGGYGRGTLAPGSDIDLLFLLPYKATPWSESIVETILYALWDLKLKVGHSVRTVDECIREARADMTIRTALLEARLLVGDAQLYAEMEDRYGQ